MTVPQFDPAAFLGDVASNSTAALPSTPAPAYTPNMPQQSEAAVLPQVQAPYSAAPVYPPPPAAYTPPMQTPQYSPPPPQTGASHWGNPGDPSQQYGGGRSDNPAHGKLYETYNPKTRRSGKTITLTPEGVQFLLQHLNAVVQNPNGKIKISIAEYTEQVKASVRSKGGYSVGSAYIKYDDGQQRGRY